VHGTCITFHKRETRLCFSLFPSLSSSPSLSLSLSLSLSVIREKNATNAPGPGKLRSRTIKRSLDRLRCLLRIHFAVRLSWKSRKEDREREREGEVGNSLATSARNATCACNGCSANADAFVTHILRRALSPSLLLPLSLSLFSSFSLTLRLTFYSSPLPSLVHATKLPFDVKRPNDRLSARSPSPSLPSHFPGPSRAVSTSSSFSSSCALPHTIIAFVPLRSPAPSF